MHYWPFKHKCKPIKKLLLLRYLLFQVVLEHSTYPTLQFKPYPTLFHQLPIKYLLTKVLEMAMVTQSKCQVTLDLLQRSLEPNGMPVQVFHYNNYYLMGKYLLDYKPEKHPSIFKKRLQGLPKKISKPIYIK